MCHRENERATVRKEGPDRIWSYWRTTIYLNGGKTIKI
jgi:hypothetical protein